MNSPSYGRAHPPAPSLRIAMNPFQVTNSGSAPARYTVRHNIALGWRQWGWDRKGRMKMTFRKLLNTTTAVACLSWPSSRGGYGSTFGVFLGTMINGIVNVGIFYIGWSTDFMGGGGLCGLPADYAAFIQMMLAGGKSKRGEAVLKPETVALMGQNHIAPLEAGVIKIVMSNLSHDVDFLFRRAARDRDKRRRKDAAWGMR